MIYAIAIILIAEFLVLTIYGPGTWGKRAWNILIALDQLVNAWAGGDPDETLSSRAAKRVHKRGWYWFARILDKIDPGHMARSREDDEGGRSAWD